MASQLNIYLTRKDYINTMIQEGWAKHMSGCIVHTAAIWDTIKESRKAGSNVNVVWLDLANTYGAVPHPPIWKALKAFHVNQGIIRMLQQCFGGFEMCFMTEDYMTSWINLRISIAIECSISPTLFVMAMELIPYVIHSWTEKHYKWAIIATIQTKAFMDDMTIFLKDLKVMQQAINKLNELLKWTKMKVKPAKSRSLTLSEGKVDPKAIFTIANNNILTVWYGHVKSLGRWYGNTLKDMSQAQEVTLCLQNIIQAIYTKRFQGKC